MRKYVLFSLCFGVGLILGRYIEQKKHVSADTASVLADKSDHSLSSDEEKKEVVPLDQFVELQVENANLRNQVVQLKNSAGVKKETNPNKGGDAWRSNRMKSYFKTENLNKLNRLKSAIGLNDDQIAQLESFFEGEGAFNSSLRSLMKDGNLSHSEIENKKIEELGFNNVDDLLLSILDETQKADYDMFLTEKQKSDREASAYSELANIQRKISLNEDQKDQVFQVLFESDSIGAKGWKHYMNVENPENEIQKMRDQNDQKIEQLSGVLAEEQLAIYTSMLNGRMAMIEGMMKRSNSNRGEK